MNSQFPYTASAANADVVGICILNWNAGECLSACVRSLEAAQSSLRFHLVVVDNDSSDDSIQVLVNEFPNTTLIRNRLNVGYATGNNIGARHLEALGCEYLIFLNPDVILPADSLASLVRALIDNPQAGCAGGIPLASVGVSAAARRRPSAFEKLVLYGPLHRFAFLRKRCRNHIVVTESLVDGQPVYAVLGACIAFRARAFRQIGGFDEHTFLYEEEFILAEKLLAARWQSVLATAARYQHAIGVSTNQIPYRRRLHFIKSEQYLVSTYYRWNRVACALLRLDRYVEWIGYSLYAGIQGGGIKGSTGNPSASSTESPISFARDLK